MSNEGEPTLRTISWELLRLGAFAFGGMGAALALLNRGLVERRKWLASSDISEALAFTRALPGSTGIQVAAYLGWRLRGWPGAFVAAVAFILPAATMMTAAAAGSLVLPDHPWVKGAMTGIQVAVVGLLAAAMVRLARSQAKGILLITVVAVSGALGFFVHAVLVMLGAGVIGAFSSDEQPHA